MPRVNRGCDLCWRVACANATGPDAELAVLCRKMARQRQMLALQVLQLAARLIQLDRELFR